jgi:NAD(P)-dependent dehydrogenase (short-subunit alcohol dehydrogenase family)
LVGTGLDVQIDAAATPETVETSLACSPTPGSAYSVSKRGVHLLAQREAAALGRRGARVVSISPGIIDTPMGRLELETHAVMRTMVETSPLARLARAEEVAAVAVFLCSPGASFMTGVDVLVDGGSIASLRAQGAVPP